MRCTDQPVIVEHALGVPTVLHVQHKFCIVALLATLSMLERLICRKVVRLWNRLVKPFMSTRPAKWRLESWKAVDRRSTDR